MRMCESCCKVSRKLSSCARCRHAWYCSTACQREAWKAHKTCCAEVNSAAQRCGRDPSIRALDLLGYLRRVMHVRHRFSVTVYLQCIVLRHACLGNTLCVEKHVALSPDVPRHHAAGAPAALPLLARLYRQRHGDGGDRRCAPCAVASRGLLWHYTWAAVPEPLRARLTAALQRLHQAAEAYTAALENGQCQDADLPFGAAMCTLCVTCVAWVLEGDDSFQAWRRGQSEAVELPHHCAGLDRPQPWDARCALTARTCQRGP